MTFEDVSEQSSLFGSGPFLTLRLESVTFFLDGSGDTPVPSGSLLSKLPLNYLLCILFFINFD